MGILVLILYYENTVYRDSSESPFEAFMDSQQFGVRLLFTTLGSLLSFFWEHLFQPSRALPVPPPLSAPQDAPSSILLTLPTNVFPGLWLALRHGNVAMGVVALWGVLTKFAPVLLSNIPFQISQTWLSHVLCTWMSVAVLGYCLLVLVWHVVRDRRGSGGSRRDLPVDPQTLAGRMYYVYDSRILGDFESLSMLGRKQRDERAARMGNKYRYGPILGVSSGEIRIMPSMEVGLSFGLCRNLDGEWLSGLARPWAPSMEVG